ncbi:MAG: hypothetical protein CMJ83_02185 [Planctomycetes bacterium]|nr:hypothetical protein [Planctomycetota bacterium]
MTNRITTLVIVVGILTVAAFAQDAPADLSEAGMNRRMAELRPAIEKIMGSTFTAPVHVRAVSRHVIERMVAAESACLRGSFLKQMKPRLLRAISRGEGQQYAHALMGKVDIATGTVHIIPANVRSLYRIGLDMRASMARGKETESAKLRRLFAAAHVDPVTSSPGFVPQEFLDILLVHESVHVRQMRHFVTVWSKIKGLSTIMTVRAVTEGQAEWVAHRYASEAGLDETLAFYHMLISGEGMLDEGMMGLVSRVTVFPYVKGHAFFKQAVEKLGLQAAERRVLMNPPTRIGSITKPEEYLAEPTPPEPPAADPPAENPFTGRLTYVGGDVGIGVGFVSVWIGHPTHDVRTFAVKDGAFDGTLPDGSKPRVELITADGLPIGELASEPFAPDAQGHISLEVARPELVTVVVRDAHKRPIAGARVWPTAEQAWIESVDGDSFFLPEAAQLDVIALISDVDGKVMFPRPKKKSLLIVATADGHGWARLGVSEEEQASPAILQLPPGGGLDLEIAGWTDLEDPHVFLSQLERGPDHDLGFFDVHAVTSPNGRARLRGVPAGMYVATVRRNDEEGFVYGSESFTVGSGKVTRQAVPTRRFPRIESLKVIIAFPKAWGDIENEKPRAVLRSFDGDPGESRQRLEFRSIGKRMFEAAASDVVPGRYVLSLQEHHWYRWLDVAADGDSVRLTVPTPRTVSVKVTAKDTGRPIQAAVKWETIEPSDSEGPWRQYRGRDRWEPTKRNGRQRKVVCQELRLHARAPGYALQQRTIETSISGSEITFELGRAGALKVELKTARGKLYREHCDFILTYLGREDLTLNEDKDIGRGTFRYLRPGLWRVETGTEVDVPNHVVEIKAGETTELVIDLEE